MTWGQLLETIKRADKPNNKLDQAIARTLDVHKITTKLNYRAWSASLPALLSLLPDQWELMSVKRLQSFRPFLAHIRHRDWLQHEQFEHADPMLALTGAVFAVLAQQHGEP